VHGVPSYGAHFHVGAAVSEPPHRLLVVEGDEQRLFVLSVRARGAADIWAVSLACVRASAKAGPRYVYTIWACPPTRERSWVGMEADVPSCAVPGAAVDEGMALCVLPELLVGPSKEIHLKVRMRVVQP